MMLRTQPLATILVVDDQRAIVEFLEELLRDEGYAVVSCSDGEQALALLTAKRPELMVSDVQMPNLDGWELVKRLRAEPAWQTLPVILMTAATKLPFDPRTLDPMTGYIEKPFMMAEFLTLVTRMLELRPLL
jgi:CheY-like chemotaxis protein